MSLKKLKTKVKGRNQAYVLIKTRDVTRLLVGQQKICDNLYQDAIEMNYSHENMTPLNCILNNSHVVIRDIEAIILRNNIKSSISDKLQTSVELLRHVS